MSTYLKQQWERAIDNENFVITLIVLFGIILCGILFFASYYVETTVDPFNDKMNQLIQRDKKLIENMRNDISENMHTLVVAENYLYQYTIDEISTIGLAKVMISKATSTQKQQHALKNLEMQYHVLIYKNSERINCVQKNISLLKQEKRTATKRLKKMEAFMGYSGDGVLWVSNKDRFMMRNLKEKLDQQTEKLKKLSQSCEE